MNDSIYDVTILGGGPTGLFGAFYAGMRHMKTAVIDSLPELGGQLLALYPEKYVYDVGGFPKILAKDLAEGLIEQAMQFHPTIVLEERVAGLERVAGGDGEDGIWRLTTDKAAYLTKTVVISAGIGAFEPRRLKVAGLERFEGCGVQYLVRDKMALAGRRVMIVGGGDSAFDWALNLQGIAESLMLIHRREEFRAHEATVQQVVGSGRVEILLHYEVRSVAGNSRLETVTIFDNRTDEEQTHAIDNLLINVGFKADLGPIKQWGLTMEKNGIVVSDRMETNLPGIYAAGDVTEHEGKLDLIATGFGEVAVAINFAKTYIDPGARAFPGHSTDEKWKTE
ncbi:MAG TPA: NAD(P)/FAD-dependent oxidoreductase [Gemmatimonadota bacterium]|nr:NAD(P)/FAD-dependent oxidoreductase [Gemmatimonadota bacterium]